MALGTARIDDIGAFNLQRVSTSSSYLLGSMFIAGIEFHVEAIEVTEDPTGEQMAGDPEWHAYFCDLHDALAEGREPFTTISIDGREYVLFISPFCR